MDAEAIPASWMGPVVGAVQAAPPGDVKPVLWLAMARGAPGGVVGIKKIDNAGSSGAPPTQPRSRNVVAWRWRRRMSCPPPTGGTASAPLLATELPVIDAQT